MEYEYVRCTVAEVFRSEVATLITSAPVCSIKGLNPRRAPGIDLTMDWSNATELEQNIIVTRDCWSWRKTLLDFGVAAEDIVVIRQTR